VQKLRCKNAGAILPNIPILRGYPNDKSNFWDQTKTRLHHDIPISNSIPNFTRFLGAVREIVKSGSSKRTFTNVVGPDLKKKKTVALTLFFSERSGTETTLNSAGCRALQFLWTDRNF